MDEGILYGRLMDLAEALEVEVRTAPVDPPGGSYCLRGRLVVMLSSEATLVEKVDLLARALADLPGIDEMYVLPQVREYLDRLRGAEG